MKTRDNAPKTIAARLVVVGALALLAGAIAWPLAGSRSSTSARPEVARAISDRDRPGEMSPADAPRARRVLDEDPAGASTEETPPDPLKPDATAGAAAEEPGTASAGQVIGRAWAQTVADERIPAEIRFGGNKSFMLFPDPDPSGPAPDDQIPADSVDAATGS